MAFSSIPLLFAMLWLPTQPTGTPASAQEAFRYVPASANFVATADVRSIATALDAGFTNLGQQPFIAKIGPINQQYKALKTKKDQVTAMARMMAGFNPFTDLHHVTIALRIEDKRRQPDWVISVRAPLPPNTLDRLAVANNKTKPARKLSNGMFYEARHQREPSLGQTSDGYYLMGSTKIVKTLLTRRPRRSKLVRAATALYDRKTFAVFFFQAPNRKIMSKLARKMGPLVGDLGLDFAGLGGSLRYDGISVVLSATTAGSRKRYSRLLDGVGHYLAAGGRFIQGSLALVDGLLPSGARHVPKQQEALRGIVKHKQALLRYLRSYFPNTPGSHSVKLEPARRWARLDYRGSRHFGITPILGAIGVWLLYAQSGNTPVVASPPMMSVPPTQGP